LDSSVPQEHVSAGLNIKTDTQLGFSKNPILSRVIPAKAGIHFVVVVEQNQRQHG